MRPRSSSKSILKTVQARHSIWPIRAGPLPSEIKTMRWNTSFLRRNQHLAFQDAFWTSYRSPGGSRRGAFWSSKVMGDNRSMGQTFLINNIPLIDSVC